jgi:hypothetical protein
MAIEETCDPVMSEPLPQAGAASLKVKRSGPVPLVSTRPSSGCQGSSGSSRPRTSRSRPASPTRSRR